MQKNYRHFFTILFVTALATCLAGQEPMQQKSVPWDSVTADIQIIESLDQPDSIKTSLTRELFDQYELTANDYRLFYDDFLEQPLEIQREFMEKVKAILQSAIKKEIIPPSKNK